MNDMQSDLDFPLSILGRKLLNSTPAPSTSNYMSRATPNPDRLVILTVLVLLCLFILGIGLNSFLRCMVQWRMRIVVDSSDEVGNKYTGLKKAAMKALPIIFYKGRSKPWPLPIDCPICLAEFAEGDKVRILPNCNHGFHMECIDKWFVSHSSCPLCRNCLNLNTPNKKPEGAATGQATESNEVIHIVMLTSMDSSHVVGVVSPHTETIKRTAEEATVTTPPQLPSPLSLSENES